MKTLYQPRDSEWWQQRPCGRWYPLHRWGSEGYSDNQSPCNQTHDPETAPANTHMSRLHAEHHKHQSRYLCLSLASTSFFFFVMLFFTTFSGSGAARLTGGLIKKWSRLKKQATCVLSLTSTYLTQTRSLPECIVWVKSIDTFHPPEPLFVVGAVSHPSSV